MKAILCTQYGPPETLQLVEVDKPTPVDQQVLVKVHAASVNPVDMTFEGGIGRLFGGLSRPKDPRLGKDLAGVVEDVGKDITQFKAGDEVFGVCQGSFADYALAREVNLVLKPGNISFEEAAAVPVAAITALQGLRDRGKVQPRQKVLINGASGGVGTFAVQIAKSFGAEVTAVCSPRNMDQARTIGADHIIDYTQEDFTRNGLQYDLILGVNGYFPILKYRHSLTSEGKYIMVGASHAHLFTALFQATLLGPLISRTGRQKLGMMGIANINQPDLAVVKELLESGKIRSVIDRHYPLSQTAEALKYLGEGHARGKIIITFE